MAGALVVAIGGSLLVIHWLSIIIMSFSDHLSETERFL